MCVCVCVCSINSSKDMQNSKLNLLSEHCTIVSGALKISRFLL